MLLYSYVLSFVFYTLLEVPALNHKIPEVPERDLSPPRKSSKTKVKSDQDFERDLSPPRRLRRKSRSPTPPADLHSHHHHKSHKSRSTISNMSPSSSRHSPSSDFLDAETLAGKGKSEVIRDSKTGKILGSLTDVATDIKHKDYELQRQMKDMNRGQKQKEFEVYSYSLSSSYLLPHLPCCRILSFVLSSSG